MLGDVFLVILNSTFDHIMLLQATCFHNLCPPSSLCDVAALLCRLHRRYVVGGHKRQMTPTTSMVNRMTTGTPLGTEGLWMDRILQCGKGCHGFQLSVLSILI